MKLEDQVVSLELAKKLKYLNVKQESQFWWIHSDWFPAEGDPYELQFKEDFPSVGRQSTDVAAFTVAELGEMLPPFVTTEKYLCKEKPRFNTHEEETIEEHSWHDDSEANCRAKMLIHLIENKKELKGWKWPYGGRGELTCPHGVGHGGTHGCDGCCSHPSFKKAKIKKLKSTIRSLKEGQGR